MAVCSWCNAEMTTARSCTLDALHREGRRLAMVPCGAEPGYRSTRGRCGDCGVARGGWHHPGCDVQRCPACGGQLVSCDCRFDEDDPADWQEYPEPYGVDANGLPMSVMWLGDQRVIVHYADIPESDVTTVDGMRCTTALRTVIDCAAELDHAAVAEMVRAGLARGLFTLDEVWERLSQPDMRTYPGAEVLRAVLSSG